MRTVQLGDQSVAPGKIACAGRNYVAHIEELNNTVPEELVVFFKPNSAIGQALHAEHRGEPLHYEAELAFMVIGNELAAVALGIDLTKRAVQTQLKSQGLPWERAKAFDGSAVFSPFVALQQPVEALALELRVDNTLRQQGGVHQMLYSPAAILNELLTFTTLEDHDIIMTGTPAGVGPVSAGECFQGRVLGGNATLIEAQWHAY